MVSCHNPDLVKPELASDRDVTDTGTGVSWVVVREGGSGTAEELLHRERNAVGMTSALCKCRAVRCDQSDAIGPPIWNGIVAPVGTPAPKVARLNAEINKARGARMIAATWTSRR